MMPEFNAMLKQLGAMLGFGTREPITLEEVQAAFSLHYPCLPLDENPDLKEESTAIYEVLRDREYRLSSTPRMELITNEVESVLYARREAKALAKREALAAAPTSKGTETLRYARLNPRFRFEITYVERDPVPSKIGNVESTLACTVRGRQAGGFVVVVERKTGEWVDAKVTLTVDVSGNDVQICDLVGNDLLKSDGAMGSVRGRGLGRCASDLANRVMQSLYSADFHVYGHATDSHSEGFLHDEPAKISAIRRNRISFWENAGLRAVDTDVQAYIAGEANRVYLESTVGELVIKAVKDRKIDHRFEMYPSLDEFLGPRIAEMHASPGYTPEL